MDTLTTTAPVTVALRHSKYSEGEKVAAVVMLCIFVVIGTIGNCLALFIFNKKKKKAFSFFLLALASTDLSTCLIAMPATMVLIWTERYLVYDAACKGYHFLISSNILLSVLIMTAIAIDRCLRICRPHSSFVTPKRSKIALLCICIFTFVFGISTAILHRVSEEKEDEETEQAIWCQNKTQILNKSLTFNNNEKVVIYFDSFGHLRNCSRNVDSVYDGGYCDLDYENFSKTLIEAHGFIYKSFFAASIMLVFISYVIIYCFVTRVRQNRKLQKSSSLVSKQTTQPSKDTSDTTCKSFQERGNLNFLANVRTAGMLFVVVIFFFISFLPCGLMSIDAVNYNVVLFYVYFIHTFANPIIYAFMNNSFRKELKGIYQRCKRGVSVV